MLIFIKTPNEDVEERVAYTTRFREINLSYKYKFVSH